MLTTYDAHAASGVTPAQASASILSITAEVTLRQFLPSAACLSPDAGVCAIADQAAQPGRMKGMLPIICPASLIPAMAAIFVFWKLPALPAANNAS